MSGEKLTIEITKYKENDAYPLSSEEVRDIKNILTDIGIALSFAGTCYMTDRPDNKHVKKLIKKELMWSNDTTIEREGLDRLNGYLNRIGIV